MKKTLAFVLGSMTMSLGLHMAHAAEVKFYDSTDPILKLRTVTYPGGKTADLTVGLGSGAYRHKNDPANIITVVADRGPNFTCKQAKKIIGEASEKPCAEIKKGRWYPVPDYTPSIYKLVLKEDMTFAIKDVISLKDRDGNPVDGMLNPLTVATTENPIDLDGKPLKHNPNAVDAEGIVKLSDGSYWIGEEMGPSLMHVASDGRILKRLVPADTEKDYADANMDVVGALPAILAKRQANRGIESVALSPDEKFLYIIMQNPLANPDKKTYLAAKNTRILKLETATQKILGEYVYQLDDPQSFKLDPSKKQNAPRISEMLALGTDHLLVLERTNGTTKLHEISLDGASNIFGSAWDDLATSPSLEASNDLSKTDIKAVTKTLRFDSADFEDIPTKLEGIAILGNGDVALINDNDFGIKGDPTRVVRLIGSDIKMD